MTRYRSIHAHDVPCGARGGNKRRIAKPGAWFDCESCKEIYATRKRYAALAKSFLKKLEDNK